MPGIAQEAARIGQHPDEAREIAVCRQRCELVDHPLPVVVEPPGAAVLHLPDGFSRLESAHHGHQRGVVVRVQGIQDRFRQLVRVVERTEEGRQLPDRGRIPDRIDPGVGTESAEHPVRVVADDAEVELHHHAEAVILPSQGEQQRGLELLFLQGCRQLAGQPPPEDGLHLCRLGRGIGHALHPVVRDPAAERDKEGQPLFENLGKLRKTRDPAQALQIRRIVCLLNAQRLVRAEAGQDLHAEGLVFGDFFVPFQAVCRVVRGAEGLYPGVHDQGPCGQRFQLFVAELPDLLGRFAVQGALITEIAAQLQMAPVIEGISDGKAQGLRPFLELLPIVGVPGDEALVHAGRAHQAPFVVIAAQPDLGDVLKAPILPDLLRVQVTVKIDDLLGRCIVAVQMLCRLGGEQKVFVHKCLHGLSFQRFTRAPAPPMMASTSLTLAIEVSPGVVMASAPCAAP